MCQRALVIGSQIAGLRGVDHDVQTMSTALHRRGFDEVTSLVGDDASREGILAGYDRLIEASGPRDAAVMYYSGHGGLLVDSEWREGSPLPRTLQFIVPTDYETGNDRDWRGIAAWELSLRLTKLTAKTHNVTVILDCCHAAEMSRDGTIEDVVARALPRPHHVGLARFLDAMRTAGARFDDLDPVANPHAVRLVAAGKSQSAYEYRPQEGAPRGAFTENLLAVMTEIGDEVISWEAIARAVQERVLRRFPNQRPDIEGPLRRKLFSTDEVPPSGAVAVIGTGDGIVLRAGRIAGVEEGDVYGVMRAGATAFQEAGSIARLTVGRVTATQARIAKVEPPAAGQALPADAIAFPLDVHAGRFRVRIEAPEQRRAELARQIADVPNLAAAEAGDLALATLRVDDAGIQIEDAIGPLFPATPDDQRGLNDALHNIKNLGVAQALRLLPVAHGMPRDAIEVELGAVVGGRMVRLPDHHGSVGLGDAIYLRLVNRCPHQLFANVFNIGLRRKVTLLSTGSASGIALKPGEEYILGRKLDGTLDGLGLTWPEGLPQDGPRTDEIVVIATEHGVDLRGLETTEVLRKAATRSARGSLQQLLDQLQTGGTRDASARFSDAYALRTVSYSLHPYEASLVGSTFAIDDNPSGARGAAEAAAWRGGAPTHTADIGIRLADLTIDATHRELGGPVRVDALVTTRAGEERAAFHAATWSLPAHDARIRAGDPLVLFQGEVSDFVELFLWISALTDEEPLRQRLAARARTREVQAAVAALRLPSPGPNGWLRAVGGSAILARIAGELVPSRTAAPVALYRTSFLASDRFGAGQHEHVSQGVRFAIHITSKTS